MTINYKLFKAKICKNRVYFFTTFFLAKNISHQVILGNPFTLLLYPFNLNIDGITCLRIPNHPIHFEFISKPKQQELNMLQKLTTQLQTSEIQNKIKEIEEKIKKELCSLNPRAFHHRKLYEISLPYEDGVNEKDIPIKAKPIHMNKEYLEYCKKEIQEYLNKG
ncbi:hypothetical protein AHAS_Ahas19G0240000 [Arachis hypogaea]